MKKSADSLVSRSFFRLMLYLLVTGSLAGCTHQPSDSKTSGVESPAPDRDAAHPERFLRDVVKIAAGQVNQDEDRYNVMLEYIDRAGAEGADLIVLPEYVAGLFSLPLKATDPVSQIAEAARKNHIYVIVGGWEEFEEGAFKARKKGGFSNTALLFDREGEVAGRYCKMHPAVGKGPHWWPSKP